MRYRVVADCVDFNQKFQKEGKIISVPDGEPVPKWFQPIDKVKSEDDLPPELLEKLGREEVEEDAQATDSALNRMNKQELLDTAGKEGADIPVGATNPEIVRLIRANRKVAKVSVERTES